MFGIGQTKDLAMEGIIALPRTFASASSPCLLFLKLAALYFNLMLERESLSL